MIGYMTFGTNDIARAAAFYDAVLAEIGAKRLMNYPTFIAWGCAMDKPSLAVIKPYDGQAASVGNGTMAAIVVDSRDKVDRLHQKALALGGKDEGPVGERSPTFYAGYFRDLDGNKLNVYCMA